MSYETPDCFGKHWDQNEPECAGGRDPNKIDANGSHIRERCTFFTACGARTAATKQEEQRSLIPATSLTRRIDAPMPTPSFQRSTYTSTTQTATSPSSFELQQLRTQLAQQSQIIQQQQQAMQNRQIQAPGVGYIPTHIPQMMAMEMSIPKYLTVPEPARAGQPIWGALGRMIVRSVIKAVGHTVANFADHNPLDRDDIYKDKPE